MRAHELRTITNSIVGPLERGLLEEVKLTEFLGADLQLRFSLCGLATAALQRYLTESHGVATTRIIIDLPETSPSLQSRHVFLRHSGSVTIDPTYSQFFEYAGFSAIDAVERPELSDLYPEEKVGVIDDGHTEQFIARFATQAYRAAQTAHGSSDRSIGELKEVYRSIWIPKTCRRFQPPPDDMVNRIVAGMTAID